MIRHVLIGLGIGISFLFMGSALWYHPTLFLLSFDRYDVDPWPQLLFTPAAYIGGVFLVLTVGTNHYFVQAIVGGAIGTAILLRHKYNPRDDDEIWPSKTVAKGIIAVGALFFALGVLATVGIIKPL